MEVEVEAVEPVVTLEPDSSRIQVSTLLLLTLIVYVVFSSFFNFFVYVFFSHNHVLLLPFYIFVWKLEANF